MSNNYWIIDNKETLQMMKEVLLEDDVPRYKLMAVDTESNGLRFWRDLVIGVSISTDSKSGFYLPFLTWKPDLASKHPKKDVYLNGCFECIWTGKQYPENVRNSEYTYPPEIVEFLKTLLTHEDVSLLCHNAPFDVLMIKKSLGFDIVENLFCDTMLLKHALDENSSNGLKETAVLWQDSLQIDADREANQEQIEMGESVIRNGGIFKKKKKTIWRADLAPMAKYAAADTFLTFGLFEVGIAKFQEEYGDSMLEWFFRDEVMPLCKEVVIPMKERGAYINVQHFEDLYKETLQKFYDLEDLVIKMLNDEGLLDTFTLGKPIEELVKKRDFIRGVAEFEGLTIPGKKDRNGKFKESFSKASIEAAYEETGHWLWSYCLGGDELKLSDQDLEQIMQKQYIKKLKRRHRFNINSPDHMRWLFITKLRNDTKKFPLTKKGLPSVKASVIKEQFKGKYDFIKPFLLYKKLGKLISSYIKPAVTLNDNGILYMEMRQDGTTSGRFSCSGGLNLQTLPKIEELEACSACGSKNITIEKPVRILADMHCKDCGHVEEEILCPSVIKAGFIAPKGYKIVNADYSSLEPRCFAYMSGEDKIKDIYRKNLDMYSKVYCDLMSQEYRHLKKSGENKTRDQFKPFALGVVYGARAPQAANLLGLRKKENRGGEIIEVLDVEKGKHYINLFFAAYPNLKNYMNDQDLKAMSLGSVETIIGRKRHFTVAPVVFRFLQAIGMDYEEFLDMPKSNLTDKGLKKNPHLAEVFTREHLQAILKTCGIAFKDPKTREWRDWVFVKAVFKNELNNSKNFPIQGLAAHIANKGMLNFTRAKKAAKLDSWVFLQVHDEISTYAKEEQAEETVAVLKEAMEKNEYALKIDVAMVADPLIADNLRDAK